MFPDLSYILHHLFGTMPDNGASVVKTFGLFLALAFLGSALFLHLEYIRKEKEGVLKPSVETVLIGEGAKPLEVLFNAFIGFLLGFKLVHIFLNFAAFKANAPGVVFSGQGNWIAGILAFLGFGAWYYYAANREKLETPIQKEVLVYPHERIGDITVVAAISGLIGARLFSVLENLKDFFADPLGQLFSGSGLTMYGGLILAYFVVYWYVRKKGIPPIHMMDAVAPALVVGYGVGRLGCHFSGDGDWGIPSTDPKPAWMGWLPDWLWSFDYAHNVNNEGQPLADCVYQYCSHLVPGVYPTPLYESFACLLTLGILWLLRKRLTIPGMLFCVYLVLNGVERLWIEKIRVNPHYDLGGMNLSQAQYIAIGLIVAGIAGGLFLWLRKRKKIAV
ncbi:MAG: hypothetical protein RLZZ292_1617 [Bacteroidota bacterium]|jgi:prolipoprotein diacylglyceryl transferase